MNQIPIVYSPKIPHHSNHSGYEQLIHYLEGAEIVPVQRFSATQFPEREVERLLRRVSLSKWYMQDGFTAEVHAVKSFLKGHKGPIHFLYGDSMIGWLPYLKWLMPNPIVLTLHAIPHELMEILHRPWLLQLIDQFILLGTNQRSFLAAHGITEAKIKVIPHGVDLDFFVPSEQPKQEKTVLKVLMVGNWKRNFELYRKVVELMSKMPIQFHVVTPEFNHHFFRACEQVVFHTNISDEALRTLYQQADVLLMGLKDAVANNVMLEAAACKLPIICERVGAVEDYFTDKAVHYVAPNDASAIQAILTQQLIDASHSHKKAKQAFREVQAFSWPSIAARTADVYRALIR